MRVLLTGLATFWGGRLARALEQDDRIETLIGVDAGEPRTELERTEFVRIANDHALLRRIVTAAAIDTVIDTRLVVDPIHTPTKAAHENNVIGTMNIVAACAGEDSPVRKLVFKSSAQWYGCAQDDPAFFTEDMERSHPPRHPTERDVVEAEKAVQDFAQRHEDRTVTVLRFANGLGPRLETSHSRLLGLPAVPCILGFDPRYGFIHEDDIVGCLEHAAFEDLPGTFNCVGDGVLVLSEVASLLGKPLAPILPPYGTGLVAAVLRRLGLDLTPEALDQLRYGRGLDNRRFKAAGYHYRYTSRETVQELRRQQQMAAVLKDAGDEYHYEREVEQFLRYSPSVRRPREDPAKTPESG